MGLASKLAAAGPPPGAYPPGGQQQQRPGQYPGQSQYQPYPGGPGGPSGPQGAPPGQYGAPPAGQYGGPPPGQYGPPGGQHASPANIQAYKQLLQTCIQNKGLQNFYPPNSPILDQVAGRAGAQIKQICDRWDLPIEVGNDIVQLALYDIILYVDDSGSMQFEENGERIKDLRIILQRVAFASTLFDDDGISIRFMNSTGQSGSPQLARMIDGVKSDQQIEQVMANIQFRGLTPMGTELRKQVIDQLVIPKVRSGALRKPILIITITDGQPAGEPQNAVVEAIKYAADECARSRYGAGAISFQFAQVGNDLKAREFLGRLDNDPLIGNLIDSTSNYENEADEMSKLPQPIDLTPQLWLVKLLLGAIDKSYDRKDEKAGASAGGYGGPAGQYGPPGGQYGGPPGQYSAPPPGQYPPPPGQQRPPPGQYGAQPGGYPPQGYGQQYPPQQGGYPGQPPYGRPPPSH